MAFIQKRDPVVVNIKLTDKGRELLSKGRLNFTKFMVGDSEIDYKFLEKTDIDATQMSVLRPKDSNPNLISGLPRFLGGDVFNDIDAIPTIQTPIKNTIKGVGFFDIDESENTATLRASSEYVKQPDAMVELSDVSGGKTLQLKKAPTYQAFIDEPSVNDIIMVRWTNVESVDTTGYEIDLSKPMPILFYKIQDIVSGTLNADNLVVEVDRELPDFNGGGAGTFAGAVIFSSDVIAGIDEEFSVDYVSEAVLSFIENFQCPTIKFPFWRMSILFTENIAGVKSDEMQYWDYDSNVLGGFVSYIQNQEPEIMKLGVIHYTNQSPSNVYAERFHIDTPTLHIPTIMWHNKQTTEMGVTLSARGNQKILTNSDTSLGTRYFDLADKDGFVVGKIFNDLKLFVIEDQELLFAMSYKSNRSWTLPKPKIAVNAGIYDCPECQLDFEVGVVEVDPCEDFDVFVSTPISITFKLKASITDGYRDDDMYLRSYRGVWRVRKVVDGSVGSVVAGGDINRTLTDNVLSDEQTINIELDALADNEEYRFEYVRTEMGVSPNPLTSADEVEFVRDCIIQPIQGCRVYQGGTIPTQAMNVTTTSNVTVDIETLGGRDEAELE